MRILKTGERTGSRPKPPEAVARAAPALSTADHWSKSAQLLPAIGLFCHRHWRKLVFANLTPASRRQDHTILPSACKTLSSEAPLASIASNPASVTIAIRPRVGGRRRYKVIWFFGKPEYFFQWGWTGQITLIRLGKLDFTRKSVGGAKRDMRHDIAKARQAFECALRAAPRQATLSAAT